MYIMNEILSLEPCAVFLAKISLRMNNNLIGKI